jgi:hypothetical protein
MISNWFSNNIKKIGFEDVKIAIEKKEYIINTLNKDEQNCLIKNTVGINSEENVINTLLDEYNMKKVRIIIYGKNCADDSIEKKFKQLSSLGFTNLYVYYGGLFEWLLLQDIYGEEEFPTTTKVIDILQYKSPRVIER